MIGFYETASSAGIIRVDDIVALTERENQHGVMIVTARMRDGSKFDTFESDRGGLLRRPVQLVAAESGTSVIWSDGTDEEPATWRATVVAWALCLDGEVRPVTANGVSDGQHGVSWVEHPNKTVVGVGEWTEPSSFDDAASFADHFRQRGVHSSQPVRFTSVELVPAGSLPS